MGSGSAAPKPQGQKWGRRGALGKVKRLEPKNSKWILGRQVQQIGSVGAK